jgi:glycosyltransferase involved in cell wall biosynthesis
MNDNPLVSVLIPCFNVSEYVLKAVNSILKQTYNNLEIWLIDDASTDDTLAVLKSIQDSRIKLVEFKENTKKVGAVNEILHLVNGDLITFQDADDWSEPERLQEQVNEFLKEPQLGICFTNYKVVGKKEYYPHRIALSDEELRDEFLNFRNKKNINFSHTNCPSMMISQEVLKSTGGYHPYFAGRVAEDIHWIYRILKQYRGITVKKYLYNYNIREESFTELQLTGKNAKYAYSWQLLAKIIQKDIHENIDLLDPVYAKDLQEIELLSCEEALLENIKALVELKLNYEGSTSLKLGRAILKPFYIFKKRR